MKNFNRLKDKYSKKKVEHFKEVLIDTCNTLLHKRGEGLYTLDMQGYFKPQKTNFNICTLLGLLFFHGSSTYAKASPCNVIRKFSVLLHYNTIYFIVISLVYLTLRLLMSYIYMEHQFLMFLDHTQRRTTVGRTPLDE